MSKKLIAITCVALMLGASCLAYGQTVTNVTVGISGSAEIETETEERYEATNQSYELDEAAQAEVNEGGEIKEEYYWSYTPAQCSGGGGVTDDFVEIQFSNDQGDDNYTIAVTYTVSLLWEGAVVSSDSDTASMQVHVSKQPSAELCSVTFDSDHGVLRDNNTTWSDEGDLFREPEWEAGESWPISHTMGEYMTITLSVKVEPDGMSFDLAGEGPGGLSFSGSATATGYEQDVVMTGGYLPNHVGVIQPTITWTIAMADGVATGWEDLDITGPHKIFLTLGDPTGSVVTEKRMAYVCGVCQDQSTLLGCADAIHSLWLPHSARPRLNACVTPPTPLWRLLSESEGACIDLARLMRLCLKMIGGDATCGYYYPSSDLLGLYHLDSGHQEKRDCLGQCPECANAHAHGNEDLCMLEIDFETQIMVANRFEGVCVVADQGETRYYPAKMPSQSSAHEVLYWWEGHNNVGQIWAFRSCPYMPNKPDWRWCQSPGPVKVILPSP